MSGRGKLPADYAIDALALEVDRRAKKMNRPDYSYGKLIADTTPEEREQIADTYRAECMNTETGTGLYPFLFR